MNKYFTSLYTKKQLLSLDLNLEIPSVGKTTIKEFTSFDDGMQHRAEVTRIDKKSTYNDALYCLEFFK